MSRTSLCCGDFVWNILDPSKVVFFLLPGAVELQWDEKWSVVTYDEDGTGTDGSINLF